MNVGDIPLTPDQCRRARELLGWSMLDLAEASGARVTAVIRLEDGARPPAAARVAALRRALEAAGVEFESESGARLRDGPAGAP